MTPHVCLSVGFSVSSLVCLSIIIFKVHFTYFYRSNCFIIGSIISFKKVFLKRFFHYYSILFLPRNMPLNSSCLKGTFPSKLKTSGKSFYQNFGLDLKFACCTNKCFGFILYLSTNKNAVQMVKSISFL